MPKFFGHSKPASSDKRWIPVLICKLIERSYSLQNKQTFMKHLTTKPSTLKIISQSRKRIKTKKRKYLNLRFRTRVELLGKYWLAKSSIFCGFGSKMCFYFIYLYLLSICGHFKMAIKLHFPLKPPSASEPLPSCRKAAAASSLAPAIIYLLIFLTQSLSPSPTEPFLFSPTICPHQK